MYQRTSKYTVDQIIEVYRLKRSGKNEWDIAKKVNLPRSNVTNIWLTVNSFLKGQRKMGPMTSQVWQKAIKQISASSTDVNVEEPVTDLVGKIGKAFQDFESALALAIAEEVEIRAAKTIDAAKQEASDAKATYKAEEERLQGIIKAMKDSSFTAKVRKSLSVINV